MHPYTDLADRQFWARAVSRDFDPGAVGTFPVPLIRAQQTIMSAGSCFAATLVPYLQSHGFQYLKLHTRHPSFIDLPGENFSYDSFSGAYGNIYTAAHLLQLLRRCLGTFSPDEDRWYADGAVIDPFRPGLRYFARSDREFDILTKQYLGSVLSAFRTCDVFIFTLGLTEAWRSKRDGAVFPACPGTIAGTFDDARHEFVNFTVDEVTRDLNAFVDELKRINRRVRIILTLSPVPLVATASGHHVVTATVYSKSVLRVACAQVVAKNDNVVYFPSYEIISGPQAPHDVFEDDRRSVSRKGVEMVMSAFFAACEVDEKVLKAEPDAHGVRPVGTRHALVELADRLSKLECEEAGQES